MASSPFQSPDLELLGSNVDGGISRPQPLRIVKRPETATHSTPRAIIDRYARGLSGSTKSSRGSPPNGPDRPLTVRKLRKGRRSALNGSFDDKNEKSPCLTSKATEENSDITPRAKHHMNRTASAGQFLQSEFYHNNDADIDTRSLRALQDPASPVDSDFAPRFSPNVDMTPRKRPKPKNIFLRAIGGRDKNVHKSLPRNDSFASTKSLLSRRLSKRASKNSNGSLEPSDQGDCLLRDSEDIAEVGINSRIYSPCYPASSIASPVPVADTHILCPQIIVTPEIESVDGGDCSFWVAVELAGVLRDGHGIDQSNQSSLSMHTTDLENYGYMKILHVKLMPVENSEVSLVWGAFDLTGLKVNQTYLALAKIRLGKAKGLSKHMKESSADLMADLERHLGNIQTSYLTVRVTYEHSAFATQETGTTTYRTTLVTEAIASIKRHDSQSDWSPRNSRTLDAAFVENPVIDLIEKHYPPEAAREALHLLANDRARIPTANRSGDFPSFSEETFKTAGPISARVDSAVGGLISESLTKKTSAAGGSSISVKTTHAPEPEPVDPARKIWSEMRKTSCGNRRLHTRSSLSDVGFNSEDSRVSSLRPAQSTPGLLRISSIEEQEDSDARDVDERRNHIMKIALKNKRSLGQDTLRSIAPSVSSKDNGRARGGTVGATGLGLGFGWPFGWGHW